MLSTENLQYPHLVLSLLVLIIMLIFSGVGAFVLSEKLFVVWRRYRYRHKVQKYRSKISKDILRTMR